MLIPIAVFGGIVAWATNRPAWLVGPPLPKPPGPKDPIIWFIGGAVGALLVHWMFGFEAAPSATELIVISIGAFAFGRFLDDIVNLVFPSKSQS